MVHSLLAARGLCVECGRLASGTRSRGSGGLGLPGRVDPADGCPGSRLHLSRDFSHPGRVENWRGGP
jgi:hypothetical protein